MTEINDQNSIDDPNCIVKAFQKHSVSIIKDATNRYFFRGSDVAKALGITNISSSIQNYTEKEKELRKVDTRGGPQDIIFLSSHGVYRLLYSSKKKVAEEFREWVGDVLDDIIFNKSAELLKQLEAQKQLFIQHKEQTKQEKEELLEKTLLSQFPVNTQCIYYGEIDDTDSVGGKLVKFGMSNNLPERVKIHKKTYTNFRLTNAFKVSNQIEIENCIKQHPTLKRRIRNIMINDSNYRELICIDPTKKDPDFSLTILEEHIKQIIEENQYNIENYKKLLETNDELQNDIRRLNQRVNDLSELNAKLQTKLDTFTPLKNADEDKLKTHNKIETTGGYSMFAFQCSEFRFKVGLCKSATVESREKMYKASYPEGQLKILVNIKHPFIEKTMLYLLKRHLTNLSNDTFDGSIDDIKRILEVSSKVEDLMINNDIENIWKVLNGEVVIEQLLDNDPEVPVMKKAKRPIDQIDKNTGNIIATYPSIEAAGRALGVSGSGVGIALRNKSICQGYIFRYTGFSNEDQMQDQPVIRVKCDTGERTSYPNMSSAAKDARISVPGLRSRIITDVHVNGFHWIFDKTATHYN